MVEYLLRPPMGFAARAVLFGAIIMIVCVVGLVGPADAETRSLKLYNAHTGERAEIAFKRNGRFIPSGLRELNRFLRDWRRNEVTKMDPHLFDLLWDVYRRSGATKPVTVVSGYRSPATNNMLRKRTRGVAKKSQHMLGKAIDYFIPGVNLAKLRAIGLREQIGGVGFYPTSGSPFVHMDTGNVRHWPRMTRQQLARVFPHGKTIHVPTDGKPMPGYKQALAELKARDRGGRQIVVASAGSAADDDDDGDGAVYASQPSIRPSPLAARATNRAVVKRAASTSGGGKSGDNKSGWSVASLWGKGGPTPPAAVGDGENSRAANAPSQPSRVARPGDRVLPGVALTSGPDLTPPAPDDTTKPDAPAPVSTPAPVLVSALPVSKPAAPTVIAAATPASQTPSEKPGDAISAIAAAVGSDGKPAAVEGRAKAQTLAYAADAQPVPLLRPRASVIAGDQLRNPGGAGASRAPANSGNATGKPVAADVPMPGERIARIDRSEGSNIAARVEAALSRTRASRPQPSLSGRIPARADPFARFAALPRANESRMISARQSTRTVAFADLHRPDQRRFVFLFDRPARVFSAGFDRRIYGTLRTDRFAGPAVVSLPLVTAD